LAVASEQRLRSNADLTSRFAAFRVRPAARDNERIEPHPVEWLLTEWPEGEDEPTKYWLSTLPEATDLTTLVDRAKLRFRIGRDYEELKSELGLAQFEGRGWRGFHHHATLTIAAYGFLIRERAAFPPSAVRIRKELAISARPRPRGAPTADAAPHPNSIATIRRHIAVAIAKRLTRCPCCQTSYHSRI
jgi:SRSO17 transposase